MQTIPRSDRCVAVVGEKRCGSNDVPLHDDVLRVYASDRQKDDRKRKSKPRISYAWSCPPDLDVWIFHKLQEKAWRPNTTLRMMSFHRARLFVLASNHGATEKQIRRFSPAGGNLFNVSSVGLDRDPEGRADHWGQGCRPIVSAWWTPSVLPLSLARSVKQFQVAPGSTTARTCTASAAGTVVVTREPETLTGIEYSKADPPVSAGRRS